MGSHITTVRRPLLLGAFLISSFFSFPGGAQQGHPEPYPNGKFCTPQGDRIGSKQTKDHPCSCKRHDQIEADDPDAKGKHEMCKAGEATNPSHDAKCLQECSEQHCACPIECDPKAHQR